MAGLDRKQIKKGLLWTALEQYSAQIIQFVIGIILARLLMPDDYAIIGMVTVFICISNAFIGAGFPSALIKKKDCTDADYSTVFYCNVLIGFVFFCLLWVSAPYIADFYGYPILTPVTRAMGLTFTIGSFGAVSQTILKRELRFRSIAIITLVTSIVTGVIAIYFAYKGFGVWALVIQSIALAAVRMILLIVSAKWHPKFIFSLESFKNLFGFGSKILGSNLITQIYQNMYNITIGKFFPASTLAYFSRASGYSSLVPINIAGVIQSALFPMLSKIQDDSGALINLNNKMTNLTSFIIFPASLILAGLAYPTISIMISDKWIDTAPLLQILCLAILPEHLYYINNDFIMIRGRSDYVMKEQMYSKIISVVILAASLPLGISAVAIGKGLGALITWGASTYYLYKVLGIKPGITIANVLPMLIVSLLIGGIDAWLFTFLPYTIINWSIVLLLSGGVYMIAAKMFFPESLAAAIKIRHRK